MKVCGRLFRPKEWLYILLLMCLPLEVTRSLTLNPIKFANIQTIHPMSRYPNYCLSRHHPIQPRNHCHHSPPLLPCLPDGIKNMVKDASTEHAIIIAFVDAIPEDYKNLSIIHNKFNIHLFPTTAKLFQIWSLTTSYWDWWNAEAGIIAIFAKPWRIQWEYGKELTWDASKFW